jgi:hypothetical protein
MDRLRTARRLGVARAAPPAQPLGSLRGIWGRPYLDLEPFVDASRFAAVDEEIALGLTQVEVTYTGGSHKWMGIVPPSLAAEPYVDYGQVIAGMSREEFARLVSLADDPAAFDLDRQKEYELGEERAYPLSRRQMLWLKYRYGVYFPWKVFYELIPTRDWEDKSTGAGKRFTEEAEEHFPRLVAAAATSWGSRPTITARCTTTAATTRRWRPITSSRSAPAATSASSSGTRTSGARWRCAAAPTGSTTAITTGSRPTPSSATRCGWTDSSVPSSSSTCAA